jgi:hypothetical protein
MGLVTWIIIGVVILAIIGLGWETFFSGVAQGVEKLGQNPVVENIANGAKSIGDEAKGAVENMR